MLSAIFEMLLYIKRTKCGLEFCCEREDAVVIRSCVHPDPIADSSDIDKHSGLPVGAAISDRSRNDPHLHIAVLVVAQIEQRTTEIS